MAKLAGRVWKLALNLYSHEPMEQKRCARQDFERLQRERLLSIKIEAVSLDSTTVKIHPDGMGALKKQVRNPSESPEADGQPKFIWLPRQPNAR